jgi:hypothetical protein
MSSDIVVVGTPLAKIAEDRDSPGHKGAPGKVAPDGAVFGKSHRYLNWKIKIIVSHG